MAETTTQTMRTPELLERLRRHYIKPGAPLPGGVFLPEVTHGRAGGRRCDALHIGFTSTSGRILTGHELKVSRADWQHELDQPGKADTWADQVHAWYVVAPSTDVVPPETLPAGWGLLTPGGRSRTRLAVVRPARVHLDRHPSWETMLSVVSRMDTLRSLEKHEERAARSHDVQAEVGRKLEGALARALAEQRRGFPDAEALAQRLERIETALGGRVHEGDDRPWVTFRSDDRWGNREPVEVPTVPLEHVGALVRAHRGVRQAALALRGRFDTEGLAKRVAHLDAELDALAALAEPTQEPDRA